MLNKYKLNKYNQEETVTPKGYMNQTRNNKRSAIPKTKEMETEGVKKLQAKKVCKFFFKVFNTCSTVFSDKIG